jgi:uncharacterized protein with von Willebrand factor type A (vWA) domain
MGYSAQAGRHGSELKALTKKLCQRNILLNPNSQKQRDFGRSRILNLVLPSVDYLIKKGALHTNRTRKKQLT